MFLISEVPLYTLKREVKGSSRVSKDLIILHRKLYTELHQGKRSSKVRFIQGIRFFHAIYFLRPLGLHQVYSRRHKLNKS